MVDHLPVILVQNLGFLLFFIFLHAIEIKKILLALTFNPNVFLEGFLTLLMIATLLSLLGSELQLKVFWAKKFLGLAIDQINTKQKLPLTIYYFCPKPKPGTN